jgi:hypothetical protein
VSEAIFTAKISFHFLAFDLCKGSVVDEHLGNVTVPVAVTDGGSADDVAGA